MLTFGVYLTARWLPGKKVALAQSIWDGYRRKIDLHVMPSLGYPDPSIATSPSGVAVRRETAPGEREAAIGTEERITDPSHHPWCAQRRRPSWDRDTKRRFGGSRAQATVDSQGRATGLDSGGTAGVSPSGCRPQAVSRLLAPRQHWAPTQ
jgi:hypothetical protein